MKKYSGPSIISGNQNFEIPTHVNYGKFVLGKLLENKNGVALINAESGEKVTYGEIAQDVVNTASTLINLGVDAGDVIGICSENRTEFLITAIAAMCTEGVVTFINRAYGRDELVHTLNISKPKYVFISPETYKSYYQIMKGMDFISKFFIFGPSVPEKNVVSFAEVTSKHVNIDTFQHLNYNRVEKTALILYSSGTTGLPKGAKLSHRNLIISALQPLAFKRGLVCLSIAPWSNTVGILLTMDEIIYHQPVVYMNRFHEENYLKCIEKYKVGLLLAVPPLVVMLSQSKLLQQYNISSVELIYCGGAPLDSSVIDEIKKSFPNLKHVLQGYGMTETSGAVTEEDDQAPRQGSVGRIVNGNIVKVVDIETRKLLGPNLPGEVCIKGPVIFQGYIGKNMSEYFDSEGFYCTGDVAYYDEDGYFYIVDRIKELIKYKAGQVAPSELEGILLQHPAVTDAAVTGTPDPLAGELPTAFVVRANGMLITEKELMDFVAAKVSSWKQLRGGVRFVQEIPKTASGKILRRKLREMLVKPPPSKL